MKTYFTQKISQTSKIFRNQTSNQAQSQVLFPLSLISQHFSLISYKEAKIPGRIVAYCNRQVQRKMKAESTWRNRIEDLDSKIRELLQFGSFVIGIYRKKSVSDEIQLFGGRCGFVERVFLGFAAHRLRESADSDSSRSTAHQMGGKYCVCKFIP